jgi:hypothetical protein
MEEIMKRKNYVLDKKPKKIWNLNQLGVSETFVGVPNASYYKNTKGNQFIKLNLDAGYSTCSIFFLIFEYPIQKLLHKKYSNSFQLARFYREVNGIPVDDNITQLHDIDWEEVIDCLNSLQTIKIQVVSKNMNGFKNIRFVGYTDESLYDFFEFKENWRLK